MLKRIFIRLAIVVLLGIPLIVLKACGIIQGPIPPAENGTQWVWVIYGIISYLIIFTSEAKDTYPSTGNDMKAESADGKIILKRFLFRLTVVVILSALLYLIKAYYEQRLVTFSEFINDITWIGRIMLIAIALCILLIGLNRPKSIDYSSSTASLYEQDDYGWGNYDESVSSDESKESDDSGSADQEETK
jgi:hypothetical protein